MISARRIVLLVALFPHVGCFAPHDPIVVSGGSTGDAESGSTTIVVTTADATTSGETTASPTTTAATDESGSSEGNDSTGRDAVCGNGMIEGDEVCDDGINDGSYGGCLPGCTEVGPHCGDGLEQPEEDCDDGDEINGNGCNVDCVVSGTVLWTRIVDGPTQGVDSGRAVAVDDEDAVYAIGTVDDASTTWIRRYDSMGTEDWTETFLGPSNGDSQPAEATWGGEPELHVVGVHDATSAGNADDAWLRRYTSGNGLVDSLTWDNPGSSDDAASGVAVNDDGQQFVLGESNRSDLGQSWDIWLRKLDAEGDEMWTQSYDTGAADHAGAVAIDGEGNVIAVGWTSVTGEGNNVWLRKYSTEGATLWTRTYNSPDDCSDYGDDVAADGDGNVVVVGRTCGDVLVLKYGSDGSVDWSETYDGPDGLLDLGAGVVADSQGAIIVAGAQWVNGHQDAWVRKYSSAGQELWTYAYDSEAGGASSDAAAVGVDSTDAVVVVGTLQDVGGGSTSDVWVQKFAP